MKIFILLALVSACTSMPMSGYHMSSQENITPRCQDRDGNYYGLGTNFRQLSDSWLCNCTYNTETSRTRLECKSPSYSNQFSRESYYKPGYIQRTRSIAAGNNPSKTSGIFTLSISVTGPTSVVQSLYIYKYAKVPGLSFTKSLLSPRIKIQSIVASYHCVFEDKVYNRNTNWRMMVNGVLVDCFCNSTAYMSCHSSRSSTSTSTTTRLRGDSADYKCQTATYRSGEYFVSRQPGGFYSICTCISMFAATCRVVTVSGQDCKFPFEDAGNLYSTCTSREIGRTPYCGTSAYGVSPPVRSNCITTIREFRTYFGYIFTTGGNANGARCHFPFSFRGVQYDQCTTKGRRVLWCATTANYDRDGRYGFCQGTTTVSTGDSEELYNRVGDPVTIECRYDNLPGRAQPTITWYKLIDGGIRQKIYTYNGATQSGREASTAGLYSGRIKMPNARQLIINNMRLEDAGTFECEITYAGTGGLYRRTDVSVAGQSRSSPSNLRYIYTPRYNRMQFLWDNPQTEHDSIRMEYQQENSGGIRQIRMPKGRRSYVTSRLRPGETYDVRLYAVTNGQDSVPSRMTLTVPRIAADRQQTGNPSHAPTVTQPLAPPRVTGNTIYLTWLSNPFQDTQLTRWVVVYEDTSTGDTKNVTLAPSSDSLTLRDLKSGQRYRITVYAVVDDNKIEVASTNVVTEHTPVELTVTPRVSDLTSSTVTIAWDAPITGAVDSYDVTYRIANEPWSPWRSYSVPASQNPSTTLRNLRPSTRYDVRITPITGQRRGGYVRYEITTAGDEPSGRLGKPRNLRVTDVTRSSFLVRWEPARDGNNIRRHRVVAYPTGNDRNPIERTTSRNSYLVQGLPGGVEYTVLVYAITSDSESLPATIIASTVNEVCRVNNIWRAANEKFYKKNVRGYMQNCTCYRTSNGGRWECDPILCRSTNGIDYQLGQIWEQPHESGMHIEACTCTLQGMTCRYKEAVVLPQEPAIRQSLGGRLVLRCPHETVGEERPTIRWVKLTNSGRVPLYTYYGARGSGRPVTEAGQLVGRMSMPNEIDFVINPVQAADAGTYECTILYPSSLARTTHQSRIEVTRRNEPIIQPTSGGVSSNNRITIPSQPRAGEITDDSISISWDVPSPRVTGYIIQYSDINDRGNVLTVEVPNANVLLRGLNPSTTYRVTVIPLTERERGQPISFSVSTTNVPEPTEPQTTTPPPVVAPRPVTNLRFGSIERTTIRAYWQIPYYFTPIDSYRVEFEPYDSEGETLSENVRTRHFRATNLQPGTSYMFRVYAVKDGVDSVPVSGVATTRPIGRILVQGQDSQRTKRLGDDAILSCMYDLSTPGSPTITWYKRASDGTKTKLAVFNTTEEVGSEFSESESVGDLSGRLRTDGPTSLIIQDLKATDDGSYQCEVAYPTGGGTGNMRINIIGPPSAVEFTSPPLSDEETTHTLSWKVAPAPRVDNFLLQVRRQGSSRKTYTSFRPPGGARSFLFRNLKAGRTYEGYIVAHNRYGDSPQSPFNFTTASSGKPYPPTGLHLSNSNPTEVTVHVSGSADGARHYKIRYAPERPEDGMLQQVVDGRPGSEAITLTNMIPNTPYVLLITSVNDHGESEPLRATLTTPAAVPEVPLGVTVNELEPRMMRLSIDGPSDDVDYYEVTYVPTVGGGSQRTIQTRGNEQTVRIALEPGTQYRVRIAAVNENGKSPFLQTLISTPQERSPPARPNTFTAIRPRSDSVTVTWTGPTDDVQYYVVEYQSRDDREPAVRNTPGKQQTVTLTGLLPETQYRVAVKAVGEGGHSPVLTDYFETEPAAPQPSDITITGASPDEVTFDLEGITSHADYYIVKYHPVGDETQETSFTTTNQEIVLTSLQPGTTYRVTVIAVLGNDRSEPLVKEITSSPGQVIEADNPVAPQAPRSLRLLERGPNSVSIVVEVPEDLESDDYLVVTYRPTSRDGNTTVIRSHTNQVRITNLMPVTRYYIEVKTVAEDLESEPFTSYFTTERVNIEPAPTNLQATTISDEEVIISWDEPEDLDDVQRYLVEYKPQSRRDLPFMRMYVQKGSPFSTLASLTPDTVYVVRVSTMRKRGDATEAATTTFRTLSRSTSAPTQPTRTEAPRQRTIDAPRGLVVSRRQSDQAELRWSPAPDPNMIDGFLIEFEPTFNRQGSPRTIRLRNEETSATLNDLTPGTEYQVRIYAVVGNHQSEPATATFMSELDSPKQLRAFPGETQITVTWRNPAGPRVGTKFSYRKGNGRWKEEYLSSDRTSYSIPIGSDNDESVEVSLTAVGGTTESSPETLTIYPRARIPTYDFPITGTYVDEVSDKRAAVVFENTRNYAPEGWQLTLLDDEEGVIGSPVDITPNIGSYPLADLKAGHIYTISVVDTEGNEISRNEFMTKVAKPRHARSRNITPDSITLSWERPHDVVTGYVVRYKPIADRDWKEVPIHQLDSPRVTLTDLEPVTLYEVQIISLYRDTVVERNETGIPAFMRFMTSTEVEPTPEPDVPPRSVSNLRVSSITEESAVAQWEPSRDLDIDMYRVILRRTDDNSMVVSTNLRNSFAQLNSLQPDTSYTLYVYAVRGNQQSNPVIEIFSTVLTQPLRVEVDNVDDTSFNVVWMPASPLDPLINNYVVTVTQTDSNEPPITRTVSNLATREAFNRLLPGTSYDITVTPLTSDGYGTRMSTRVTTDLPAPRNVRVQDISNDRFAVTWDAPSDVISEYIVEYRTEDSLDNFKQRVRDNTEAVITDLNPNTAYAVSVYSIFNNKRSSAVVTRATTLPQSAIPIPQDVEVFDHQSPAYGPSTFDVRWRQIDGYDHFVTVTRKGANQPVYEEIVTGSRSEVGDLTPSTTYVVSVYVVDSDSGIQSIPVSVNTKTKPRSPPTIYVQDTNDNSVRITWPNVGIDGVDIDGYLIKYSTNNGEVIEERVSSPSFILTSLPPSTTLHDFSIQTMVDGALSEPYVYPRVITVGALSPPRRVTILPEPEVGPDSYMVTWIPIPDYGGSYEISYNPSDESQTKRLISQPGASSQRLPRLLPGVRYVVKVSPTASPVPESTTTEGITTGIPPPTSFTSSSVTDNSAVLQFAAPDYDTVTMYEVRYHPVGFPSQVRRLRIRPRADKIVRLEGLEPNTRYTAQAITYAGLNTSPPKVLNFNTRAPSSTPSPEPTPPPQENPAPLSSQAVRDGVYNVRWPAYDGAIQYYKLIYSKQSGGPPTQVVIPSYTTEFELSQLLPSETYRVQVIAVLPQSKEIIIGSVDIETDGDGAGERSATIEWVHQDDDFSRYRIVATPLGNPLATPLTWIRQANETTARLTGLYPGTRYNVVVSGYSNGRYITILESTINTVVDSPTNLRASRIQTTSITLEWDKPKAPIDGYSLTYQLNGRGPKISNIPAPRINAERINLRNLSPGQRYVIRLYATSSAGDSIPAQLWTETAVPSPIRFQAKQVTPNLIGLKWEKPVDSLTHYTLRVVGPEDQVIVDNQRVGPDETTHVIRNLQPDTRYHMYLTGWIGDLHSQPAYRSSLTPRKIEKHSPYLQSLEFRILLEPKKADAGVTSKHGKATDDGYLITWKGRSRSVEGWLIVVESEDGADRFENTVERFTKRYELNNLRVGVAYTVKIYPYSGSIYGKPSIITIPASQSTTRVTTNTIWRMQLPQVTSDSVTLVWNSPFYNTPVEEYELVYKRLSEPNAAYRLAPTQPRPNDLTATINNLEPGESYAIRLIAFHAARQPGEDRLTVRLLANVTTPLPPPTALHLERQADGSTVLTWQPSTVSVSHYVLKYRITEEDIEHEFTTLTLPGDTTTSTLSSLIPGESYEIQLYAEKGRYRSNTIIFRIEIPAEQANECKDTETQQVYQVGEHWISETDGFRMNCTCNGPQTYDCDTGDWCHVEGQIYNAGDTWQNQYENNKKELCICRGRSGYECYPRNCQENGRWYDAGSPWVSTMDGLQCTCTCPTEVTQPCLTRCDSA